MKDKRRLFIFDIDGTLFDHATFSVPKSTSEAIKKLSENTDNIIAIATGRGHFGVVHLDGILEHVQYIISANGQVLTENGKIVYSNPLDKAMLDDIYAHFTDKGVTCGFSGFDKNALNLFDEDSDFAKMYREKEAKFKENGPRNDIPPLFELAEYYHRDNDVYQLWLQGDERTAKEIEELFPNLRCVSWGGDGMDVIPKGVSKVSGIEKLKELLNCHDVDTYCFGDGFNDIEMIKYADYGVAMGNAVDEVKAVANHITTNVDEDGIYNALTHFKVI